MAYIKQTGYGGSKWIGGGGDHGDSVWNSGGESG